MATSDRRAARRQKGAPLEQYEEQSGPAYVTVQRVHPTAWAVDVSTDSGAVLRGVPLPTTGLWELPELGDRFVCIFVSGHPSLLHAAGGSPAAGTGARTRVIDGAAVSAASSEQPATAAHVPADMLPGDKAVLSRDGNGLLVLRGGSNVLRSSAFSSIETHAQEELVRITARTFQLRTGGGELRWGTTGGKSRLALDFGPDEAHEGGAFAQNTRVQLRLGDGGDMASLRFLAATGQEDASWRIDNAGQLRSRARRVTSEVNEAVDLRAGSLRAYSSSSVELESRSTAVVEAGTTLRLVAGGDARIQAFNNISMRSFGGVGITATRGTQITSNGALIPTPLSTAIGMTATNGSIELDIGNPLLGDFGIARSGFRVTTYTGDIKMTALAGAFAVDTLTPLSVKLGGPPILPHPAPGAPGLFGAVLYEALVAFFEVFGNAIDTHVHMTTGGPSSVPISAVGLPYQASRALLLKARSVYVTLGG